jgi:competence protein ComEA
VDGATYRRCVLRFGRQRRVSPEEVAHAQARLQRVVGGAIGPAMTGGWTPEQPAFPRVQDPTVEQPSIADGLRNLPRRFELGRPAAYGVIVVALLAVAISFGVGLHARARPVTVRAPAAPPAAGVSAASPSPSPARLLVVDVAGRVRRPGLVRLPSGDRVADALRAAGGVRPRTDLTSLNLAAQLVDGEQIVVGTPATGPATSTASGAAAPGAGALVNINTADATALDALPGIGPVLAQRIVDYRTAHGTFHDVGQLQDVSGIGPAKYADLRNLVTV